MWCVCACGGDGGYKVLEMWAIRMEGVVNEISTMSRKQVLVIGDSSQVREEWEMVQGSI